MRKSEVWVQKFFILARFWLDNLFIWLDFDSIFDSIGSKFKSQNYSTRPDSTVNDSVGSWLEQFPTRPIPNVRYLTLFWHLSELFTKFQPMLEFVKYKIQCTQYIYFQKFYKIHFHFSFYTIHRMFKFQKHPLNSASRYMKALRGLNPWGLLQSLTFNFNF